MTRSRFCKGGARAGIQIERVQFLQFLSPSIGTKVPKYIDQVNQPRLATAASDRGEVAPDLPMERMLLVLTRDAAAESSLQSLIAQQQDKSSPDFHAWLSPAQFGERFGASKADLQKLTAWLGSHGFRVIRAGRGGITIEFNGTAGQVKEGFPTPIHSYLVYGVEHYSNAADPQLP